MVLDFGASNLFPQSEMDEEGLSKRTGKTGYWSCAGMNFAAKENGESYQDDAGSYVCMSIQTIRAAVLGLPDGATITRGVVFFSGGAGETWTLYRVSNTAATWDEIINSAAMNALTNADQRYATVDNVNYSYMIRTSVLAINDKVFSARVEWVK